MVFDRQLYDCTSPIHGYSRGEQPSSSAAIRLPRHPRECEHCLRQEVSPCNPNCNEPGPTWLTTTSNASRSNKRRRSGLRTSRTMPFYATWPSENERVMDGKLRLSASWGTTNLRILLANPK